MSKKLILFISVLALGFFLSLTISVAGRSSQPEGESFIEEGNSIEERLDEILDSLDIEDEGSRDDLVQELDQLSGQFLEDQEYNKEFHRIISLIITLLTDKNLF